MVVFWFSRLDALIGLFYIKGGNTRSPMPLGTLLRIHFKQPWFGYSNPAMEPSRTLLAICAVFQSQFLVIMQQFCLSLICNRGLKANTEQIVNFFALFNLWMVLHRLISTMGMLLWYGNEAINP